MRLEPQRFDAIADCARLLFTGTYTIIVQMPHGRRYDAAFVLR